MSRQRPQARERPPPPENLERFLSAPLLHAGLDPYRDESDEPLHFFNPLQLGPLHAGSYGTLYFDAGVGRERFEAVLALLQVKVTSRRYSVFESSLRFEEVLEARYIRQLRLVCREALVEAFGSLSAEQAATAPDRDDSLGEALHLFVEQEEARFGTSMCPDLYGSLGGDGDWAKEALCFGFMVEEARLGVYRIWSRPWLVTK